MYSETRLKEKYSSYVSMCQDENIDPEKVLSFQEYCQMYLEIVQPDSQNRK